MPPVASGSAIRAVGTCASAATTCTASTVATVAACYCACRVAACPAATTTAEARCRCGEPPSDESGVSIFCAVAAVATYPASRRAAAAVCSAIVVYSSTNTSVAPDICRRYSTTTPTTCTARAECTHTCTARHAVLRSVTISTRAARHYKYPSGIGGAV